MAGLKTRYKVAGIAIGVGALLGLAKCGMDSGLIPTPAGLAAFVPQKSSNTLAGNVSERPVATYELAANPSSVQGCPRMLSIAWNGASAITLANGGPRTKDDSLVKQYSGGCLQIERQDDYNVQKDELVKFAQGVKNGDPAPQGAAFTVMMGDAYAAYAQSLQERMKALGQEVVVIGVVGFSYGEDKAMGRPLNGNPQNAKGSVLAGVPYDGDWNTLVKWASDNNLRINARQDTYDKEAINTVDTGSFTDADDKYVNGYCEDRKEVVAGKPTGKTVKACVDGVMTWFPGDRFVVTHKGGLTTWASTREYNQQMPTVIITTKAWAEKNRGYIVGLLRAFDRAAFDIRTSSDGVKRLGITQAAVFGTAGGEEATPEFWSKAFASYEVTDAQGNRVSLGGTRSITLAEARDYFGLSSGSLNVYKGVYETFGDYAKAFYPKDVPDYPPFERVVDTSFITAALAGVNVGEAAKTFTESKSITQAVSTRDYAIEFETGSARITPAGMRALNQIASSAAMTQLRIRIVGHTDNTGNQAANLSLSRARAQAVADALTALASSTFPKERLEVQGLGDSSPVADNATEAGRAKNRRVEITFGS
jgi:OOP family OmpA-OmpF porin